MTRTLSLLRRNERGAGAIEFALIAPALFALVVGIAQLGIVFGAHAGLKHAVGEAARYATTYPRPSNAQLTAMIEQKRFGFDPDLITTTYTPGTVSGRNFITIKITYPVQMKIPLVGPDTITLVEERRAYVHPA